jgi:MFS family permease
VRRPLYGWLGAEGVSLAGTRVSMIALPFFVLTTTGSPEKTGLVALAEMLPLVVLKVLGGPIIDRVGARRVAISCDWASLAVVGALRGPGDAAKSAMIPTLAATAGVPLERVTGLHSTVERTASMLGAAIAGGLVAVIGPANALVVDAVSFGVSALLLAWAIPARTRQVSPDQDADPAPYLEQLRAGWLFLRGDRVLVGITVMVALTNLIDLAWAAVLVPVWGIEHGGGAAAVGALFATFAGASAIGSLVAAAYGDRLPRYATYLVCFLVTGLPRFVLMGLDTPLWGILSFCVVAGVASGFLNPILGAVIYERVPERLLGRVTSLTTACCFALMPLGGLVGGFLVGGVGLGAAMLVCGAAYFVVTMLPAVDPRWRDLDRRPQPDREGVPSYV